VIGWEVKGRWGREGEVGGGVCSMDEERVEAM